MQLRLSFSVLLSTVLLSLSGVDAAPLNQPAGVISLPLAPLQRRSDLHPQVLYQLHLNRGLKRYAAMTGGQMPSREVLSENLRKRLIATGTTLPTKRFNQHGIPPNVKRFNHHGVPLDSRALSDSAEKAEMDEIIKKLEEEGVDVEVGPDGEITGGQEQGPLEGEEPSEGEETGELPPIGEPPAGEEPEQDPEDQNPPSQGGSRQGQIGGPLAEAAAAEGVLALADEPTAENSVGLDIEFNDVGYVATVQIGTPPRPFSLIMDSGSADTWVGAENCQRIDGPGNCGNHQFLGPESSSSFRDSRRPFDVKYGTGEVAGTIVQDDFVLAGMKLSKHIFGVATQESVEFASSRTPFDGLVGTAQSRLSNQGTLTPVESMKEKGLIRAAITSYKIPRRIDDKNDGQITFGGLDEAKFDRQTLVTLPNLSRVGFWEAAMDEVTVNNRSLNFDGRSAILDTGTTLMLIPTPDAVAIHEAIPGAKLLNAAQGPEGGFTVPCDTDTVLSLSFGNTAFDITPSDLAFAPLGQGSQDCVSGISAGSIGRDNQWLVGDTFLKNAYFSHNVDENSMSLAKLV